MSKVWLITGSSRGLGTRELLTVAFSVAPVSISRPQSIRLLNYLKTVESAPLIPKKRRFSGPSLEPSWNQVGTRLLGMRQFCRAHLAKEDYLRIATIHPETPDAPASRIARPGFVPSAVVEFSNSLA